MLGFFNSQATIVVTNGLSKIHSISPNGIQEGVITLNNTGSKDEAFKCYLNDLSTNCKGEVFYQNPGESVNSLSSFISIAVLEGVIAPGQNYELVYKIDLNNCDRSDGSLWSLLMLEIVDPISNTVAENGFAVGSKIRYGIQLVANIGSQTESKLKFTQVQLGQDLEENKVLEASLENDGSYIALPLVEIQIYNDKGVKVKELSVPSKKIYPQNCQKFQLPIADLQSGKYKAVLFAEYKENTIGLNIDLEI